MDLKKARDRCTQNKDPGRACSYSLLIANYGGIMAVPTDPPYCLVYPTMYSTGVEDQNHSNAAASLSGLCTHSCICHALFQHTDMEPVCRRTYMCSCLIIPHGTQYKTLFPEIAAPCKLQRPLIDHNTGSLTQWWLQETYALWTPYFQAVLGRVSCSKRMTLPESREKASTSPLVRRRNLSLQYPRKRAAGTPGLHHPGYLTPQAAGSHLTGENATPQPRTMTLKNTGLPPPSTRTGPAVTKQAWL